MNRVTAKIAEEVGILFEHDRVDAGTRQQDAQEDAARAAADDADVGGEGLRRAHHATRLRSLSGTYTRFRSSLPWRCARTLASPSASASASSSVTPACTGIRARTLPLTCTTSVISSTVNARGSGSR